MAYLIAINLEGVRYYYAGTCAPATRDVTSRDVVHYQAEPWDTAVLRARGMDAESVFVGR